MTSPIVTTFECSIVGTETTQTPDVTTPYMMAIVADPQTFNEQDVPRPTNQLVLGSERIVARKAAPQTLPRAMFGVLATETSQTPDVTAAFFMAVVDDPQSDNDWSIFNNYTPNRKNTIPPQIGGG
jgi:hypothetical protein